jgi:hypothetical protein
MENEKFDARVTAQMKSVIVQLEDHDLVQAEESVRLLAEEVQMVTRRRCASERSPMSKNAFIAAWGKFNPFTALIRFRAAPTSWLAA